jgi:hypothetical protein
VCVQRGFQCHRAVCLANDMTMHVFTVRPQTAVWTYS